MTDRWRSSNGLAASRLLSLLLLSLLATSCGDSRFKKVYPAKGRVLVNGEPAVGVDVRFTALDDAEDLIARPSAVTDDDGWFIVSTYKAYDGMPAGSYAVSMIWLPKDYIGPREKANKLPMHYSQPETSGIKVQIIKGENVLPPFELTTKK